MRFIIFLFAVLCSFLTVGYGLQNPLSNLFHNHGFQVPSSSISSKRPNIVFILTDDQDLQMNSLSYMPVVRNQLMEKGVFYRNHFVTTALCCPARVTLMTGRHAHNTNVTDVIPPWGGYPKFVSQGFNDRIGHLNLWLQQSGYSTYYAGKLFNALTVDNYDKPFVSGFNQSDFLLDPYTYTYLNSTFQRNHDAPISYEGRHSADVLAEKAYRFLDEAIKHNREDEHPFMLTIGTPVCHSGIEAKSLSDFDSEFKCTAPIPPARFAHLFPDAKVPRNPNFNPDVPSSVNWIRDLPQQNESNVAYNDHFYRNRLRALQTVEELVSGVIKKLEDANLLDNTYIIYTSDNGYHIGQHRLQPGKQCGFEEDIRVPMFIRGPGIPENEVVDAVTTHVDIAPTIFEMVGLARRDDFDGVPVPLVPPHHLFGKHPPKIELRSESGPLTSSRSPGRHEHVNVEFWGLSTWEGELGRREGSTLPVVIYNNTYKALRIVGEDYNFYYSVWCNNAHELYDLVNDPYQMDNLFSSPYFSSKYILGRRIGTVVDRLDALLLVTKSCKGWECVEPWRVLHPDGDVQSLRDALDERFDPFYRQQYKVLYTRCELGYIIDAEGPQEALAYTTRNGLSWSDWA